jgi:hypothetical protein
MRICTVYVVVVYLDFEGNAPCEVNFILDLIVWITFYISQRMDHNVWITMYGSQCMDQRYSRIRNHLLSIVSVIQFWLYG